MKTKVYSQGREIPEKFFLGKMHRDEVGIFETLRTYGEGVFKETEHLKRLFESAKTAGFKLRHTEAQLRREIKAAVNAYRRDNAGDTDLTIRMTFFQDALFLMVGARPHPQSIFENGVRLRTSPVKRSLSNAWFPETKTSAYQNAILASVEPRDGEVYEWLFLDRDGFVTEVRIGNIFIVKKRAGRTVLATPLTPGILNGVTRRFVIECALQCSIKVLETPITRHEVYNADEVFLTNTSWEILPVSFLDGRKIGALLPGPVTSKLHRHFKNRVVEELS